MMVYASMVRPDVVVVTSIASDHIKHMLSLDDTAREKALMLQGLRPGGTAVLNGDDPRVLAMRASSPSSITYGFGRDHQVRCVEALLDWPQGTRLTVDVDGQRVIVRSRLLGKVMVYPMLAALAVSRVLGLDRQAVVQRLEAVEPVPGRLHPVLLARGAAILRDDHKASAESFAAAFDLLEDIPAQRRLVLLGDIHEPQGDVDGLYRELALPLARICDGAYLMGDAFRCWLSGLIAGGLPRDRIVCLRDLREASERLRDDLRPGDVVLIKGPSKKRLERVAFALAGRLVPCTLDHCEAMNLDCDRCGGRDNPHRRSLGERERGEEFTPEILDAVEHSLWRRYNDRVVSDFLTPHLTSQRSLVLKTDVFEEALGHRSYPQALAKEASLVGMDLSRVVLQEARKRVPQIHLVRADVRRIPLGTSTLMGVVSTSTLDHFSDPWDLKNALAEIARVLRPGGSLLLTLDNPWNPLLALRNAIPHRLRLLFRLTPYYVGITCDPNQIVGALEEVGFEVCEMRALLHVPRSLVGLWGQFSRGTGLNGLDDPLLRWLSWAEAMARWPTRWLTGQYIAVRAERNP